MMRTSTTASPQRTESQRLPWLTVAVVFWVANVTLHLEFSNWLVRPYNTPWGQFVPRDFSSHGAVLCALLLLFVLWNKISRGESKLIHGATWVLWFTGASAAFGLIMTTPIEAIHYVQYGMLAWIVARALDPEREKWPLLTLLFITAGLGILDELNQYFLLTPGNSSYVDFNDFVLNQIGAQAGLFAYYAGLNHGKTLQFMELKSAAAKITLACYGLFGLAVLLLAMFGRLAHTPPVPVPAGGLLYTGRTWTIFLEREPGLLESWQTGFGGGQYYVLGVAGGITVMTILTVLTLCYRHIMTATE